MNPQSAQRAPVPASGYSTPLKKDEVRRQEAQEEEEEEEEKGTNLICPIKI